MIQKEKHNGIPQMYGRRVTALLCSLILSSSAAAFPAGFPVTASAADAAAELFVSPDGDDSNPGTEAAPLRTLAGARDAVRKINGSADGDIIVWLRGGTYRQTEAVQFDTRDSGQNGHRIIYQAYEGETPVISGAVPVSGWTQHNDKLWSAPLDRSYKLRNLYVNDHRAVMGSVGAGAQGGYGTYGVTAGKGDWAWDSGQKSDGIK